jgi:hypothetical protein
MSAERRDDDRAGEPTDSDLCRNARAIRLLMMVALADALRIVACEPAPARRREELRWLMADDANHPFAFVAICDVLGVDPGAVRQRVLATAASSLARRLSACTNGAWRRKRHTCGTAAKGGRPAGVVVASAALMPDCHEDAGLYPLPARVG